jgi:WD40 repeat protein
MSLFLLHLCSTAWLWQKQPVLYSFFDCSIKILTSSVWIIELSSRIRKLQLIESEVDHLSVDVLSGLQMAHLWEILSFLCLNDFQVWDRRTLSESNPKPVGVLAGHMDGITFIDPRGDGRHLISNCKDQSIKLWDVRVFSGTDGQRNTRKAVSHQTWDYRWQTVPKKRELNYFKLWSCCKLTTLLETSGFCFA